MIHLIVMFVLFANMISKLDSQPLFCETHQFDGAFNFGPFLVIRKDNWIWFYDYEEHVMLEPALNQSEIFSLESGLLLLTSFYINKVPKCDSTLFECDDYDNALHLAPIKLYDYNTNESLNGAYRLTPNGTQLDVENPGYPWFIDVLNLDIWPQEWKLDEKTVNVFSRASAYWSDRYEVLFIGGNGNVDTSAILYNSISQNNWWLNLREQKLFTKIHFIGLFHLLGKMYALADNRYDNDDQTKLYKVLVSENNQFSIEKNAIGLKAFFGCEQNMIPTTPSDKQFTDAEEKAVEDNKKQRSSPSLLVIIVIIIIVLVIIIAAIVVIVFIVIRKIKKPQNTVTSSEQNSPSLSTDSTGSTGSDTSDTETINSETGESVSHN